MFLWIYLIERSLSRGSESTDQYFLMGIDDLYASNRSYDGAVPGAVSPIDWIGPLWYVGGIGCRKVFPMLLELLHLQQMCTCIMINKFNTHAY